MDLWIRSQDKRALYCVRHLRINGLDIMCFSGELLGTYSSEERTLEILDEIQNVIIKSNKVILKTKGSLSLSSLKSAKKYFERLNNETISVYDDNFEIIPGNLSSVVYQMPKE